jgi:hypothetical protein
MNSILFTRETALVIMSILSIFSLKCAITSKGENMTSKYFDGIELQYENNFQKETIERALNDILSLEETELITRRYFDYRGKEQNWTLENVIYRYFVPNDSQKKLGDNFYRELKTKEVQVQIKKLLEKLVM